MFEDYRHLNVVTHQYMYCMLILEELFDSIGDFDTFIIVDPRQDFNLIVLIVQDRKKTSFHGRNRLWKMLVMIFELKNASIFFQRIIDKMLEDANFLKCYIDDV